MFPELEKLLREFTWPTIIGLALSIVSLVYAIRSTKTKKIACVTRSFCLVDERVGSLPSIHISYKRSKVKALSWTAVVIWSAGNDTVNHTDMPAAGQLTVRLKNNCQILLAAMPPGDKLDEKIGKCVNKAENSFWVEVSQNKQSASVSFDYIDKGDVGFLFLMHTGRSNEDVEISGCVKGGGNIIRVRLLRPYQRHLETSVSVTCWLIMGVSILLVITGLYKGYWAILSLAAMLFFYATAFKLHNDYSRIPKDFERFTPERTTPQ